MGIFLCANKNTKRLTTDPFSELGDNRKREGMDLDKLGHLLTHIMMTSCNYLNIKPYPTMDIKYQFGTEQCFIVTMNNQMALENYKKIRFIYINGACLQLVPK